MALVRCPDARPVRAGATGLTGTLHIRARSSCCSARSRASSSDQRSPSSRAASARPRGPLGRAPTPSAVPIVARRPRQLVVGADAIGRAQELQRAARIAVRRHEDADVLEQERKAPPIVEATVGLEARGEQRSGLVALPQRPVDVRKRVMCDGQHLAHRRSPPALGPPRYRGPARHRGDLPGSRRPRCCSVRSRSPSGSRARDGSASACSLNERDAAKSPRSTRDDAKILPRSPPGLRGPRSVPGWPRSRDRSVPCRRGRRAARRRAQQMQGPAHPGLVADRREVPFRRPQPLHRLVEPALAACDLAERDLGPARDDTSPSASAAARARARSHPRVRGRRRASGSGRASATPRRAPRRPPAATGAQVVDRRGVRVGRLRRVPGTAEILDLLGLVVRCQ